MDVRAPLVSLSPSLDMRLLTAFAGADASFTSGDLSRITGASRSGVALALERLALSGVLDVETHGRTNAYRLNRDHLLAESVLLAAGAGDRLRKRARELILRWQIAPIEVTLFGSAARGDGDSHSDIDVFVLRPDTIDADDPTWSSQLTDLQDALQRWTGNACEILTLSQGEWVDARASNAAITAEVDRDGIPLFPEPAL